MNRANNAIRVGHRDCQAHSLLIEFNLKINKLVISIIFKENKIIKIFQRSLVQVLAREQKMIPTIIDIQKQNRIT